MIGVEKLKNFKSFKIPLNPIDIYKYKLKNFRPRIKLQFETSKYIVKTVESHTELIKALKLRHRVFFEKTKKIAKLDRDKFDMIADHLLLIDKNSKEVVGTYCLIRSNFSKEFYTESEFFIDKIKSIKDPILEI
jgi:putative hemolysin